MNRVNQFIFDVAHKTRRRRNRRPHARERLKCTWRWHRVTADARLRRKCGARPRADFAGDSMRWMVALALVSFSLPANATWDGTGPGPGLTGNDTGGIIQWT